MEPIQLTQLLVATRAETRGLAPGLARGLTDENLVLTRVSIDSRTLQPGDLFWALRGKNHDGHDFVNEAICRGAKACVVERDDASRLTGPCIVVDDTRRALADFARWYRHQCEALVIGVTGSVGKTTTREMIHALLSA